MEGRKTGTEIAREINGKRQERERDREMDRDWERSETKEIERKEKGSLREG